MLKLRAEHMLGQVENLWEDGTLHPQLLKAGRDWPKFKHQDGIHAHASYDMHSQPPCLSFSFEREWQKPDKEQCQEDSSYFGPRNLMATGISSVFRSSESRGFCVQECLDSFFFAGALGQVWGLRLTLGTFLWTWPHFGPDLVLYYKPMVALERLRWELCSLKISWVRKCAHCEECKADLSQPHAQVSGS